MQKVECMSSQLVTLSLLVNWTWIFPSYFRTTPQLFTSMVDHINFSPSQIFSFTFPLINLVSQIHRTLGEASYHFASKFNVGTGKKNYKRKLNMTGQPSKLIGSTRQFIVCDLCLLIACINLLKYILTK